MSMSNLTAQQRIDKNGKLVTRHVKADTAASAKGLGVPAPTVAETFVMDPAKLHARNKREFKKLVDSYADLKKMNGWKDWTQRYAESVIKPDTLALLVEKGSHPDYGPHVMHRTMALLTGNRSKNLDMVYRNVAIFSEMEQGYRAEMVDKGSWRNQPWMMFGHFEFYAREYVCGNNAQKEKPSQVKEMEAVMHALLSLSINQSEGSGRSKYDHMPYYTRKMYDNLRSAAHLLSSKPQDQLDTIDFFAKHKDHAEQLAQFVILRGPRAPEVYEEYLTLAPALSIGAL